MTALRRYFASPQNEWSPGSVLDGAANDSDESDDDIDISPACVVDVDPVSHARSAVGKFVENSDSDEESDEEGHKEFTKAMDTNYDSEEETDEDEHKEFTKEMGLNSESEEESNKGKYVDKNTSIAGGSKNNNKNADDKRSKKSYESKEKYSPRFIELRAKIYKTNDKDLRKIIDDMVKLFEESVPEHDTVSLDAFRKLA